MIQKTQNSVLKSIICLSFLLFFSFFCVSCKKVNNDLDMKYFTLSSSCYTLFNSYDEVSTSSTDFIGSVPKFRKYDKININLSSEWLYSYKINKLLIDIETNQTAELQFSIVFTNLKDGVIVGAKQVKQKTFTLYKTYQANVTKTEEIIIDDIIELSTAETIITIELVNTEVYDEFPALNFAVSNVKLNGNLSYK